MASAAQASTSAVTLDGPRPTRAKNHATLITTSFSVSKLMPSRSKIAASAGTSLQVNTARDDKGKGRCEAIPTTRHPAISTESTSTADVLRCSDSSISSSSSSTGDSQEVSSIIDDSRKLAGPSASLAVSARPALALSPQAIIRLRNFLTRSPSAVAKLRIADIVGTVDAEGNEQRPIVRRGKVLSSTRPADDSTSHGTSIPCNVIACFPFERCEIVATIVKTKAIHTIQRRWVKMPSAATGEGPSSPRPPMQDVEIATEVVSLIFYELDDESGSGITCLVHPNKVYPALEHRRRRPLLEAESSSSSIDSDASSSLRDCPDDGRGTDVRAGQPKSDPRLWIYRYEKPPQPPTVSRSALESREAQKVAVPILSEGTVVRISGKITLNPRTGERQLEAFEVTPIKPEEDRYPEWHHARRCKTLLKDLYSDRVRVRELLDLNDTTSPASAGPHNNLENQTRSANLDQTTTSYISMSDITGVDVSISASFAQDGASLLASNGDTRSFTSQLGKRKRAKLPSLKTLAEQRVDITKERFLLYVHAHLRDLAKASVEVGLEQRKVEVSGGMLHSVRRTTLSELRRDKSLDWLATKCARLEGKQAAAAAAAAAADASVSSEACTATSRTMPRGSAMTPKQYTRSRNVNQCALATSAANSLILPSSSPCRGVTPFHASREDTASMTTPSAVKKRKRTDPLGTSLHRGAMDCNSPIMTWKDPSNSRSKSSSEEAKAYLSQDWIERRKTWLFSWVVKKLWQDGTIVVFPAESEFLGPKENEDPGARRYESEEAMTAITTPTARINQKKDKSSRSACLMEQDPTIRGEAPSPSCTATPTAQKKRLQRGSHDPHCPIEKDPNVPSTSLSTSVRTTSAAVATSDFQRKRSSRLTAAREACKSEHADQRSFTATTSVCEESYALITPELILGHVKAALVAYDARSKDEERKKQHQQRRGELHSLNTGRPACEATSHDDAEGYKVDFILDYIKRNDEQWRYLPRETVAEALSRAFKV